MTTTDTILTRVEFAAANDGYTYAPADGWVIVSIAPDVFAAHWRGSHADEPAIKVTLWNGEKPETVTAGARDMYEYDPVNDRDVLSRVYVTPVVNATAEQSADYEAYTDALRYIQGILSAAKYAYAYTTGKVNVVKGRKVPHGVYTVLYSGEGQYGPYVDVTDANGKRYNFVSRANVELIPNWNAHFRGYEGATFLVALGESEFEDTTAWLVLADYLEEHENRSSLTCKWIRHFATTKGIVKLKHKDGGYMFSLATPIPV